LDIWIFQKALAQRLTLWALVSLILGALCFLPEGDFWGGLAFQFLGWALIILGIASFGYFSIRRHLAELTTAEKKSIAPEETNKMIFLLQGSATLSLVCVLGGLALIFFMQAHGSFWIGAGVGIILQGFFMFFFNRYHARKLQ
jgi:hypothetical protein